MFDPTRRGVLWFDINGASLDSRQVTRNVKNTERKNTRTGTGRKPRSTELSERVLAFYLNSRDFNGYPCSKLGDACGVSAEAFQAQLCSAIIECKIAVNFADRHPNPHIRAFPDDNPGDQLAKVKTVPLSQACVYPTPTNLSGRLGRTTYRDRPFTRALALGAAQLDLCFFRLEVLEIYRNDPRYRYDCNDVGGHISVTDEYFESTHLQESDRIVLQHFGFGYDDKFNRYVAAFVRDLHSLSPEHQQIWRAKQVEDEIRPNPNWFAGQMGHWPKEGPITDAFVEELRVLNAFSRAMGRDPLFREDFSNASRPKAFGFLVRPTLLAFNDFVHVLDKMLSENINRAFFRNDVAFETERIRDDGKIIVEQKGTLTALEEWVRSKFQSGDDGSSLDTLFKTMKRVRKLRQQPAHVLEEDQFDQKYFKDQRRLLIDAYSALRLLRLVFANHPATKTQKVPDWLFEGRICSY